jgi:crossover junction endodeoxyribonuclease RusA
MIRFSFPLPAKPLNMNDRDGHPAQTRRRSTVWRHAAYYAAVNAINTGRLKRGLPFAVVQLTIPVKSLRRRRDPSNWAPTTKAVVDGLVDAGVWPDDSAEFVATVEPRFVQVVRADGAVVVEIRPAAVPAEAPW